MAPEQTSVLVDHLFRHQYGRILAHLARLLGPAHLELAEEAAQEAMLRALQTWPDQGVPENPPAWLFRVAQNHAIDSVRRQKLGAEKSAQFAAGIVQPHSTSVPDPDLEEQLRDDELRLLFMCCHPAIPRNARIVLSLKIACGFSVREIARAFLAADETVAQQLVRAKRRIRDMELSLEMPRGAELSERLDSVTEAIYFLFNEGYGAHEGEDLIRGELCAEALRLGELIATSSIATPRVHALVALMALQAARLASRTDQTGDLILLEDQERSGWDGRLLAAGFHYFELSIAGEEVSIYHLQAAIAANHARAKDRESIDWPEILELYDRLFAMNPSPVVALNRAVALARVKGSAEALASIESLSLPGYYLLLAVRGHLLLDLGKRAEAAARFVEALACRCSEPERRFLRRKIAECAPDQGAGVASGLPFSTT